VRTRGIGIEQIFGKCGGFFSNNVNPLALNALDWKFLAIYCGWIFFELCFIYFIYPETSGRTLEELAFCKFLSSLITSILDRGGFFPTSGCEANPCVIVFEDKELAEMAVMAVEKQIHTEDMDMEAKQAVIHSENVTSKV